MCLGSVWLWLRANWEFNKQAICAFIDSCWVRSWKPGRVLLAADRARVGSSKAVQQPLSVLPQTTLPAFSSGTGSAPAPLLPSFCSPVFSNARSAIVLWRIDLFTRNETETTDSVQIGGTGTRSLSQTRWTKLPALNCMFSVPWHVGF